MSGRDLGVNLLQAVGSSTVAIAHLLFRAVQTVFHRSKVQKLGP